MTANDNPQPRALRGYLQVLLVLGVLGAGVIGNGLLKRNDHESPLRATASATPQVAVVWPEVRDLPIRIEEVGTVQARNSIQLSPLVSGRVVAVSPNLAAGGFFAAGEVLFRLDPADYQANVNRALAEQAAARADLSFERAEAEIARNEWSLVYPGESIPDLVARLPQIRRAEAALQSANAALADAEIKLSRVAFSLPFSGRMQSTTIEIGQNLIAGQSYGRAYNGADIEVYVPVTTTVLAQLEPVLDRQATVSARAGDDRAQPQFRAHVVRADAELNTQTRLGGLALRFDTTVPLLPGAFVDVVLYGPIIESAHLVPEDALSAHREVWVVEGDQLARRAPDILHSDEGFVVTAPFDFADGVVLSPLRNPRADDAVRVVSTPESAAGAP
ncbi:MAG: efflux RND transporter periplasmic adaptor subunit [Pseudomonadota bacterium]